MDSGELDQTMAAWLDEQGDIGDTIQQSPTSTIVPSPRSPGTTGQQAVEILRQLAKGGDTLGGGLEITDTIGEGGMGIVRMAEQRSLGRKVAVKTLRPERDGEAASMDLLYEGWVTGALEHPNVVPVYDMGLDRDGRPVIVFKRIEGVEWAELMDDEDEVRRRFGENDLLEWNLEILLRVLDAVRFAHSRGILHRDLKPENVMIGEFGEVYVLDWGIAVSLRDDRTGRLPLASEAKQMAGTPCYMAPEMLGEGDLPLTERTDIYLCGAILHEILTGDIHRTMVKPPSRW